jgi:hypothetical protein
LFVKPEGVSGDWERSDLWQSAALIDDIEVVSDPGGALAEQFGAATSGQVYLFDEKARLTFSGGITPTRSHQGDSVGRQRIVSLVTKGASDRDTSAVYGCSLDEDDASDFWLTWLRTSKFVKEGEGK